MSGFESTLRIDPTATISRHATIAAPGVIEANVLVGPNVYIEAGVLLMAGSTVCRNEVMKTSSNGRQLENNVSVGPGVRLHDEVEIGAGAVIPSQDCIAHIGSFGTKNRVITVYGSELGPRFSLGCHIGVDYEYMSWQIKAANHSSSDSAASYRPYLGVFASIGGTVQQAYGHEKKLIREIEKRRRDCGLPVAIHNVAL